MKIFEKILILAAAVLVTFCTGCGRADAEKNETKAFTIVVSIPAPTHGWAAGVEWSAENMKKELEAKYPGSIVELVTAKDPEEQAKGIETLLMKNPDALVVMSQDPKPLTNVCSRAKKQGVFLVVVSNPIPTVASDVFVNGDNYSFGAAAAHAMAAALNKQGRIFMLSGPTSPIVNDRIKGFKDVLTKDYPAIEIVSENNGDWGMESGQKLMEAFLQAQINVDGVWVGDDDMLSGALKAFERSGRKDIKAFVGGGAAKIIVKKVLDNDPAVKATVTYPPAMINTGIMAAVNALQNGKKAEKAEIIVPSKIVDNSNAKEYYFPDSPY